MIEAETFMAEAKERVIEQLRARRDAGKYDTIVAVVQSPADTFHTGTPFETSQPQFDFCAERHALHNLFHANPECTSFERLFVAGAVPDASESVTTPCGACRHALHEVNPEATVYCSHVVREPEGWNEFPSVEQFTVEELYPSAYDPPTWE